MTTNDSSVQYAYALDDQGVLTHILDAVRTGHYTCPGCKSALTPVLGEINAKHFRHAHECCALETYLHQCAKLAFFARYEESLKEGGAPVVLELEREVHCRSPKRALLIHHKVDCIRRIPARYNLSTLFDQAHLEQEDGETGFRPDVMLSHRNRAGLVYIEICVTHPCTPAKIAAGIPILEFKISTLEDIELLRSGSFSIHDERMTAYNFAVPPHASDVCTDACAVGDVPIATWSLSGSGRLHEQVTPFRDVHEVDWTSLTSWPDALPESDKVVRLRHFLREADPNGWYPNCLLCNQSSHWESGYLYCSSKRKRVPYTEAQQCADYEADE